VYDLWVLPADSALDLAAQLRRRELSSVELVRHCLGAIRRANPDLGAFVAVAERRALREAEQADRAARRGGRAARVGGACRALA
jgi:Asp-tRNA(Asn)/Glu-tRNA(Gln) amidotransferase A subunit family amidase